MPSSQAFSRLLFHLLKASNCSKKSQISSCCARCVFQQLQVSQSCSAKVQGRSGPGDFLGRFSMFINNSITCGVGEQMKWGVKTEMLSCTIMVERGERSRVSRLARPQQRYVAQSTEQLLERDSVLSYAFLCQWQPMGASAMRSRAVTCVQTPGMAAGSCPRDYCLVYDCRTLILPPSCPGFSLQLSMD